MKDSSLVTRISLSIPVAIILLFVVSISAQSPCSPLDTDFDGWLPGSVYYDISGLPNENSERTQASDAFSAWNAALAARGIYLEFKPTDANHPATFTVQLGTPSGGYSAETAITHVGGPNVTNAVTTIVQNNTNLIDPEASGYSSIFKKVMLHEIGHTLGITDMPIPNINANCGGQTAGQSVMNGKCGVNDQGNDLPTFIPSCDQASVSSQTDTYPHECNPTQNELQWCDTHFGWWDYDMCECNDFSSPIIIDTSGDGFSLTNLDNGVRFDLNNDGIAERTSWTSAHANDAWLFLDRNGNGLVDNGSELFGNYTPQPDPAPGRERNGFLALGEYDKPANGGNNDGKISVADSVLSSLRLWQDSNHNGVSESSEIKTLSFLGIGSIDLDYKSSKTVDEYGNQFRYRTKVKNGKGAQLGRWAWDVFLLTSP